MKRASIKVGIAIIVLGIAILAYIINYSYLRYSSLPNNFSANRKNIGEKLYTSVTERAAELEYAYPEEPLDVMTLYRDTRLLIYGDIIINDDLITDVIRIQRQLWSDELLNKTTEQEQFDNLKKSLDALGENRIRLTKAEVTSTGYDPFDQNICTANVSEYGINLDRLDWKYYLIKDSAGRWKINTWEPVSQ